MQKGCEKTPEEAIYILNNTAWLGTDKGIEVYPAVKKAVESLEKQMPKKPKTFINEIYYYCPACSEQIELVPIDHNVTTYCLNCGQAIDWSGDDDDKNSR